jgi:hypothetical protein
MSFSDILSVISLALGTAAIIIAYVIYRRQSGQSDRQLNIINQQLSIIKQIDDLTDRQNQRATALANLELREKFGTISSRAERLEAVRHKTSADLQLGQHLTPRQKEQVLEWRAQLMYLLYDCLAVDEVYEHAGASAKQEFKELMFGYNEVWKDLPMIHGERAELHVDDAHSLLTFFSRRLRAYATDGDRREQLVHQPIDHGAQGRAASSQGT